MPYTRMHHDVDPKESILKELGDISGIEVFNTHVLIATYVRPNKTKSGIHLTDKYVEEDKYQGKVGLVVKKGPLAFVDEEQDWFKGVEVNVSDWVFYRPSDGWSMNVHGVQCRVLRDIDIRGRIPAPDAVW